jgi:hypothetical protein
MAGSLGVFNSLEDADEHSLAHVVCFSRAHFSL